MNPFNRRLSLGIALVAFALAASARAADTPDVNAANEQAMKAAVARVAPAVVKIDTTGGLEVIGGGKKGGGPASPGISRGTGATTGLVVDADGYVITSSFNFANKPTNISVTVPGHARKYVASIVAADQTRMLTLLKLNDAKGLSLPTPYPKKDVKVGQWALALGRTLDPNTDHPPSVANGIISATNRLWGKAVQTDAKVSPANYGGPLVSIDGRVFGVLIPASTRSDNETAGYEWYDSGIAFAVPLEDVLAKLPALKKGDALRRGLLGINPQGSDVYNARPVIGAVQPDSAADRAGLKVGDTIVAIDDKPVPNFSTVQHVLGPKYEGDVVKIKVLRGDKDLEFPKVTLLGTATAYVNAFLGILPLRDDPTPGVVIRFVYPKSPADAAGLKEGDRITRFGPASATTLVPVRNRQQFSALLAQLKPGTEVKVEVKRKAGEKAETVTAKLATIPDAIPEKLPMPSSAGKALEAQPKEKGALAPTLPGFPPRKKDPEPKKAPAPKEKTSTAATEPVAIQKDDPFNPNPKKATKKPKVETGYIERTDESLGRKYWLYVPDNYDENTSHGLVVWFHPAGQGGKDGEVMARTFREFCEGHHFILMGPKSNNPEGWLPSETELVMNDVKKVLGQYTFDRSRVVAHGMGNGGQMAFYVGFNARDVFRGVATIGATLGTPPKDNVANQPVSFFLAVGDKDPLLKDVEAGKQALEEKRFPVVYRVMTESGKEYFDVKTFTELLNWMDSLDKI
jgi:S1-C subfamily serine protease/predicted esterase